MTEVFLPGVAFVALMVALWCVPALERQRIARMADRYRRQCEREQSARFVRVVRGSLH